MARKTLDLEKLTHALDRLAVATAESVPAFERAAAGTECFIREWARSQFEFCLTATDEEIREADRLFGG